MRDLLTITTRYNGHCNEKRPMKMSCYVVVKSGVPLDSIFSIAFPSMQVKYYPSFNDAFVEKVFLLYLHLDIFENSNPFGKCI